MSRIFVGYAILVRNLAFNSPSCTDSGILSAKLKAKIKEKMDSSVRQRREQDSRIRHV